MVMKFIDFEFICVYMCLFTHARCQYEKANRRPDPTDHTMSGVENYADADTIFLQEKHF